MATRPPEQTPGDQSPTGDQEPAAPTTDEPESVRSVDELATLLRAVVLVGIDHATPTTFGALFGLRCVQDRAPDTGDDALTAAARDVIRDALEALGEGNYGRAGRLLFGATDDTRGQPARERRRLAAYQIDVMPDWFRRRYEPQIAADVATEVLAIEHATGQDPAAAPDSGTGATVVSIRDHAPDPGDGGTAVAPVEAQSRSRSGRRHMLTRVRPLWRSADVAPTPDGEDAPVALASAPRALTPVATQPGQLERVLKGLRDQQTRKEWNLVWLIGGVFVFVRYGLDAVPRYLLVLAVFAAAKTATDMLREWRATRSLAQGDQWPRLLLRVAVVVVAGGFIVGQDTDTPPPPEPCAGLMTDPTCQTTTTATTETHPSPNYVPTTLAELTAPAAPECPPEQNAERRLVHTGQPPLCINPDADYIATLSTNFGDFEIDLNTTDAPWTVNNFVYLARWRFYDGVTILPAPQPHIDASSMVVSDPVAPHDADQAPGYSLTFEATTLPPPVQDFPAIEPLYVVMTDFYHPQRWTIVVSDTARAQLEATPSAWPLLGLIRCGADVIADDPSPTGPLHPAYTTAPIVIHHTTITELPTPAPPDDHHPERRCDAGPAGQLPNP